MATRLLCCSSVSLIVHRIQTFLACLRTACYWACIQLWSALGSFTPVKEV